MVMRAVRAKKHHIPRKYNENLRPSHLEKTLSFIGILKIKRIYFSA